MHFPVGRSEFTDRPTCLGRDVSQPIPKTGNENHSPNPTRDLRTNRCFNGNLLKLDSSKGTEGIQCLPKLNTSTLENSHYRPPNIFGRPIESARSESAQTPQLTDQFAKRLTSSRFSVICRTRLEKNWWLSV